MSDKVKARVPKGCASVSFAGEEYVANKKGEIEVPPEALADLAHHGVVPIAGSEEKAAQPEEAAQPPAA